MERVADDSLRHVIAIKEALRSAAVVAGALIFLKLIYLELEAFLVLIIVKVNQGVIIEDEEVFSGHERGDLIVAGGSHDDHIARVGRVDDTLIDEGLDIDEPVRLVFLVDCFIGALLSQRLFN